MREYSTSTELQEVQCARAGVLKRECAAEPPGGLAGMQIPGPHPRASDLVGVEWRPRIHIPNKLVVCSFPASLNNLLASSIKWR